MRVYKGNPTKTKWPVKKTTLKKDRSKRVLCEDGPWAGHSIFLTSDMKTAVMTVNGVRGYYDDKGYWQSV